ncbi:MAG: hypothetical protein E6Q59_00855 [Nitrosomonas sp.]|nr:MAG: hypothetical protein E6Q59_00855 [Nitrosomonas sp.]
MTFNPNLHHRRSIRLPGYDYSQAGAYFITICTHDRAPLFGKIVDGVMMLNAAGNIVNEEWHKTGQIRHQIALHEFVIMPNHIHGIIQLVGARCTRPDCPHANCTCPNGIQPNEMHVDSDEQTARIQPGRVQRAPTVPSPTSIIQPTPTVGDVVRGFKSSVTKRVNALPGISGQRVWQRNYYEHIIRNEDAYLKIAEYIQTNPQRWETDTYHV